MVDWLNDSSTHLHRDVSEELKSGVNCYGICSCLQYPPLPVNFKPIIVANKYIFLGHNIGAVSEIC